MSNFGARDEKEKEREKGKASRRANLPESPLPAFDEPWNPKTFKIIISQSI
jgi:hypothetical protein